MRLEQAIDESPVRAAYRPYYNDPNVMQDYTMAKYIVVTGYYEYTYIVYADTFKYWKDLPNTDIYKVEGKSDWEPVGVNKNANS